MTTITTSELEIRYGKTVALTCVNIEIPSGSLVCVIGPNGAGKSAFLKALAGTVEIPGEKSNFKAHALPLSCNRLTLTPLYQLVSVMLSHLPVIQYEELLSVSGKKTITLLKMLLIVLILESLKRSNFMNCQEGNVNVFSLPKV